MIWICQTYHHPINPNPDFFNSKLYLRSVYGTTTSYNTSSSHHRSLASYSNFPKWTTPLPTFLCWRFNSICRGIDGANKGRRGVFTEILFWLWAKCELQKIKHILLSYSSEGGGKSIKLGNCHTTTLNLGRSLRAPSIHGRIRKTLFHNLIDEVSLKLEGWKTRYLTFAGRLTLVICNQPTCQKDCMRPLINSSTDFVGQIKKM